MSKKNELDDKKLAEAPAREKPMSVFILHAPESLSVFSSGSTRTLADRLTDMSEGLNERANSLSKEQSVFLGSYMEAKGVEVALSQSWDEMMWAVNSGSVHAVFFDPKGFLDDAEEGAARSDWSARRAQQGVAFVAFDLSSRHLPARHGYQPDAITGVCESSDLFYLEGSAQTILEKARLARALKESIEIEGALNAAREPRAPRRGL